MKLQSAMGAAEPLSHELEPKPSKTKTKQKKKKQRERRQTEEEAVQQWSLNALTSKGVERSLEEANEIKDDTKRQQLCRYHSCRRLEPCLCILIHKEQGITDFVDDM